MFLETVGKAEEFAELKDPDWECDFAFGSNGPLERPKSEVAWEECVHDRALFTHTRIQSQAESLFLTNDLHVPHTFPNAGHP